MTDEIRGAEPTQVIIDEPVFTPEMVERLLSVETSYNSRLWDGVIPSVGPAQQAQHHVYNTNTSGWPIGDPWAPQPYVSPANQDVRSDEADPGDQTYTHDATVATIPVDVALKLCAEHPILQSLVKFHNVEDNKGDTGKLCQGAAIDLAMSVLDAGHVWKQARKATPQDRWLRQAQKVANFAERYGVRGNAYRGVHVEHPEAPQAVLNSNPQKSGARAKRKAKRKAKR